MKKNLEKKQLGVFWGQDSLTFVLTNDGNVTTSFEVNLDNENPIDPDSLSNAIQNTLNHLNISGLNVNLAIPLKDIILRSFTIPWVRPKELKSIVEFEAGKYIPFDLNDLNYSFHSTIIKENSSRAIHIIFIAVKKNILEKYLITLSNAGLNVIVAEPSSSSLSRLLNFKEVLSLKKSRAILIKNKSISQIIITDNGIPQFVRDFQTFAPENNINDTGLTREASNKCVNEVRISIDFFRRQEQNIQIEEILIISSNPEENIKERFENDLKISATSINSNDIIQSENPEINGGLNAFGTSIYSQVKNDVDLNFLASKKKSFVASPKLKKILLSRFVIATSIACIIALFSMYKISNHKHVQATLKINKLKAILGAKSSLGEKTLENKKTEIEEQLKKMKLIHIQTNTTFFLAALSSLRPKGVWINSMKITFKSNQDFTPVIKISGNGYLKNINEQNKLANKFLKRLKSDKAFSGYFSKIELDSIKLRTIDEYNVAVFKLTCE